MQIFVNGIGKFKTAYNAKAVLPTDKKRKYDRKISILICESFEKYNMVPISKDFKLEIFEMNSKHMIKNAAC